MFTVKKITSYLWTIFFTVDNTKIFITTDTQFLLDRYQTYYQSVDLIFTIIERMNNRIWCAQ